MGVKLREEIGYAFALGRNIDAIVDRLAERGWDLSKFTLNLKRKCKENQWHVARLAKKAAVSLLAMQQLRGGRRRSPTVERLDPSRRRASLQH